MLLLFEASLNNDEADAQWTSNLEIVCVYCRKIRLICTVSDLSMKSKKKHQNGEFKYTTGWFNGRKWLCGTMVFWKCVWLTEVGLGRVLNMDKLSFWTWILAKHMFKFVMLCKYFCRKLAIFGKFTCMCVQCYAAVGLSVMLHSA